MPLVPLRARLTVLGRFSLLTLINSVEIPSTTFHQ